MSICKNSHSNIVNSNEQKHLAIIINTEHGFEEFNRDIRVSVKSKEKIASATDSFRNSIDSLELNNDAKALVLYELLKEYLNPTLSEGKNEHVS